MQYLKLGLGVFSLLFLFSSFTAEPPAENVQDKDVAVQWMTWEEAIEANAKHPKKIFVDVYTNWCGWCKRMDKTTFADKKIATYLNENFYCVKFNAEQKEDVLYKEMTLKHIANGRRGVHELAYALLDGKMSYPSYVYLDETEQRITISPGFKEVDPFMKELKYISGDYFKTTTFDDYLKNN